MNEVKCSDGVCDEVVGANFHLIVSALIDTVLAGEGPRITGGDLFCVTVRNHMHISHFKEIRNGESDGERSINSVLAVRAKCLVVESDLDFLRDGGGQKDGE